MVQTSAGRFPVRSFKRRKRVSWLVLIAGVGGLRDRDCQWVRMGKTFEKPHLLFTGTLVADSSNW